MALDCRTLVLEWHYQPTKGKTMNKATSEQIAAAVAKQQKAKALAAISQIASASKESK